MRQFTPSKHVKLSTIREVRKSFLRLPSLNMVKQEGISFSWKTIWASAKFIRLRSVLQNWITAFAGDKKRQLSTNNSERRISGLQSFFSQFRSQHPKLPNQRPNILIFLFISGVTDSKAVKGPKSMLDLTGVASTSSIVVIVVGSAAGLIFTIMVVCLFVTCRRKVNKPSTIPAN